MIQLTIAIFRTCHKGFGYVKSIKTCLFIVGFKEKVNMATKKQHYVPKVYIKSWKTQVETNKEPQKNFLVYTDLIMVKLLVMDAPVTQYFGNHIYTQSVFVNCI